MFTLSSLKSGAGFSRVMRRACAFGAAALALGAVGVMLPAVAHAAPAFALVDMDKVYQQSKERAQQDTVLQAYAKSLQSAYQKQQEAIMLTRDQQQSLGQLLVHDTPSVNDTASIQKLMDSSKQDFDKLNALQQKQDKGETLTDQDKLDFSTLKAQFQAGQQTLNDINQSYQQMWEQRNQQVRDEITAKIKDAVATVAQKQNIQVVFTTQSAIYAAVDITKDVVTAMNK